MKQGRASRFGPTGQKVEPNPKAVNPGAVSYLGSKLGNHTTDDGDFTFKGTPWSAGKGYSAPSPKTGWDGSAPGAGMTTRKGGSQGKY